MSLAHDNRAAVFPAPRKRRTAMRSAKRRKFLPITASATTAGVLFVAALLGEALGDELKQFFAPVLTHWRWLLGLAFCLNVLSAAWDRWQAEEPDDPTTPAPVNQRNLGVGGHVTHSTLTTGNENLIATHTQGDVFKGDKHVHLHQSAPQAFNPLQQIPAPPADFTGRQDELRELLEGIAGGVVISGVQGQGGIGKTALALKLAEALAQQFAGARLYLDLRGMSAQPLTSGAAMEHVIRAFHPELGRLPDAPAQLHALYQSVLQAAVAEGQRILLLFDNSQDRAQVEPLIPPAGCLMLVTARTHFTLPGMRERHLDALPEDKARELLARLCERCGAQAVELQELSELCGRLPLALRVAGSFLRERPDYPVARYLEKLRAARLRQLPEVAASLALSYAQLPPELQTHWRALAVFPADFDVTAAAAVLDVAANDAQDVLSELVRYSLLDWVAATGRYRWHDLAREYARGIASEAERHAAAARHAAHYCRMLAEARALYEQGGPAILDGLRLYNEERDHIAAGQAWAAARQARDQARDDEAAQLCIEYADAGAYVLSLRLHPREQIRWLENQLAAARRLQRRLMEGNALGNLGLAYADLGETRKAIVFYEQGLFIDREIGDRRGEGADLGNLGVAYKNLGEPRKAIEFYEQALVIYREIGDRRGEGSALGNLGNAYAALGETHKAIVFYEQYRVESESESGQAGRTRAGHCARRERAQNL
jgi:tetratricopeptide (TPR) repeat protein